MTYHVDVLRVEKDIVFLQEGIALDVLQLKRLLSCNPAFRLLKSFVRLLGRSRRLFVIELG